MAPWILRLLAPTLAVAAGVAVALGAYAATSTRTVATAVSPCGGCPPFFSEAFPGLTVYPPIFISRWEEAHFDLLTGEPRGWSYTRPNRTTPGETTTVGPVPPDMVGRWAVPLPLGFAIGSLGAYTVLVVARRWSQAAHQTGSSPGGDGGPGID